MRSWRPSWRYLEPSKVHCPECGEPIWKQDFGKPQVICTGCQAILKFVIGEGGEEYGQYKVLTHGKQWRQESDSPSASSPEMENLFENDARPSFKGPKPIKKEAKAKPSGPKWAHCNYCQAVIMLSNAKFCSNCGASLARGSEDATPLGMEDKAAPSDHLRALGHEEECMVCNLQLNEDDNVAWCPHCGSPAHRAHLLEWIHAKHACPICRERLNEQDLNA